MCRISISVASLLLSLSAFAQQQDAVWPFGFHEFPGQDAWGNAALHFDPTAPAIEPLDWLINFDATSTAISDADGNLIMATNGCVIVNNQGDTIRTVDGGIGFSGALEELIYCGDVGFPIPQASFMLPSPVGNGEYYVFRLRTEYHPERKWRLNALAYTLVNPDTLNGQGLILEPEKVMPTEKFYLDNANAVRHGNGRDWWIIVSSLDDNIYDQWILTPEGLQRVNDQEIGPVLSCPRRGSAVFSPDGQKYARTRNCRTVVYDFDRCTGLMSNPIVFDRPDYVFGGGGVAFSPSGRYLFVTEQLAVLAADLFSPSPSLDTIVPSDSTIGVSLGLLQAGPDGRLYANSTHRSRYLASFNQTDDLSDLDYQPRGVFLEKHSSRTLPYFPNYRLYDLDGSPCDTLGISATSAPWVGQPPKMWPNPASDVLNLIYPSPQEIIQIELLNSLGQSVLVQPQWTDKINVGHLPQGLYHVYVRHQKGWVYSTRILIQ